MRELCPPQDSLYNLALIHPCLTLDYFRRSDPTAKAKCDGLWGGLASSYKLTFSISVVLCYIYSLLSKRNDTIPSISVRERSSPSAPHCFFYM